MSNRKDQPVAKVAPVTKVDTAAAEKALEAIDSQVEEAKAVVVKRATKEEREAGFTVLASAVWQHQGASFQSVAKLADGSKIEVRGATEGETNEKLKEALAEKGYSGESLGGYDGGKYNEWLRASAAG